jgi:hypothetical protein
MLSPSGPLPTNTAKARQIPEGSLSSFGIDGAFSQDLPANTNGEFSGFT